MINLIFRFSFLAVSLIIFLMPTILVAEKVLRHEKPILVVEKGIRHEKPIFVVEKGVRHEKPIVFQSVYILLLLEH